MKLGIGFIGIAVACMGIFMGCDPGGGTSASDADGTLTVTFSGTGYDGDYLICEVVKENGDYHDTPVLGLNRKEIVGGSAEMVMKIPTDNPNSPPDLLTTSEDWIGSGGVSYDAHIFIEEDGDHPQYYLDSGDFYYGTNDNGLKQYLQDGDITIETLDSDFTEYNPGP